MSHYPIALRIDIIFCYGTFSTLISHSCHDRQNQNKQRLAKFQIVMTTSVVTHEIGLIESRDN